MDTDIKEEIVHNILSNSPPSLEIFNPEYKGKWVLDLNQLTCQILSRDIGSTVIFAKYLKDSSMVIQRLIFEDYFESKKRLFTALHCAVYIDSEEFLKLLFDFFPMECDKAMKKDHERAYFFSLPYLCLLNKSIKCWKFLVDNGYDTSPVDANSIICNNIIQTADFHTFTSIVSSITEEQLEEFERNHFDLNAPILGYNNLMALCILSFCPNIRIFKFLLKKNCQIPQYLTTLDISYKTLRKVNSSEVTTTLLAANIIPTL